MERMKLAGTFNPLYQMQWCNTLDRIRAVLNVQTEGNFENYICVPNNLKIDQP